MPCTQDSRYTRCHSPGLPLGEEELQISAQECVKAVGRSWRGGGEMGNAWREPCPHTSWECRKEMMRLYFSILDCLHSNLMLQIQKKKCFSLIPTYCHQNPCSLCCFCSWTSQSRNKSTMTVKDGEDLWEYVCTFTAYTFLMSNSGQPQQILMSLADIF